MCVKVTAQNKGSGIIRARDFQDVDGMITDVPGVVLATFYADCVPLYFVDPVNRAIGLSHSGWRGTVGKIGRETVEAMGREYGTRAQDLTVAIGPSICRQCYEVSEDVIRQFQRNFSQGAVAGAVRFQRKRKVSVGSLEGEPVYSGGGRGPA